MNSANKANILLLLLVVQGGIGKETALLLLKNGINVYLLSNSLLSPELIEGIPDLIFLDICSFK